jgi:hypothetical protein
MIKQRMGDGMGGVGFGMLWDRVWDAKVEMEIHWDGLGLALGSDLWCYGMDLGRSLVFGPMSWSNI